MFRVLVGGIIPDDDIPNLQAFGVARVFGPGTSIPEIAKFVGATGASADE